MLSVLTAVLYSGAHPSSNSLSQTLGLMGRLFVCVVLYRGAGLAWDVSVRHLPVLTIWVDMISRISSIVKWMPESLVPKPDRFHPGIFRFPEPSCSVLLSRLSQSWYSVPCSQ
jgi:hypothetical protein